VPHLLYSAGMLRWCLVCLLSVGLAFAYTHRTNISFVLPDPNFIAYFGLTDRGRGTLTSAFFWTYGLLQIPAGSLVDRFGPKWPLACGLFLWCLVSAATGLAGTFLTVLLLRLLLGMAETIVTPAGLRWIRDHFEERRRGLASGIFFSGSKYGPAVAAPAAAWLITRHGWRAMFIVQGLAGLAWLVPWLLFSSGGRGPMRETAADGEARGTVRSLFTSRFMWGTLIGTFCYNYFVFYALSWLPAYFVERRHVSLTSMGIFTGFSYGGMATVAVLGGLAADWWIARGADALATRRGFTIAGLLVASTEIFGAATESVNGAVFFSILSMTGLGLATANYWSLPQTAMPKAMAGRVAGAQNMALTVAGIAAPLITGWLKEWSGGYAAPMAVIGVLMIVGVGAYVFLVRSPGEKVRL
jgi:MFS transporter, ACS family, D-galactonate transporter